jgi:CBS domain
MKERSLRDLFHLVRQVLPEDQQIVFLGPDTPVADALALMRERGFDQLPVVEGSEVLGVFSYRSFAQGIPRLPVPVRTRLTDILTLPVDNFYERLRFAQISENSRRSWTISIREVQCWLGRTRTCWAS